MPSGILVGGLFIEKKSSRYLAVGTSNVATTDIKLLCVCGSELNEVSYNMDHALSKCQKQP